MSNRKNYFRSLNLSHQALSSTPLKTAFSYLSVFLITLCGLSSPVSASMCKILYRSYYNFKSVAPANGEFVFRLNKLRNRVHQGSSFYTLHFRLCTNFNDTLGSVCKEKIQTTSDDTADLSFGNLVLSDSEKRCYNLASIEKSIEKTRWNVEYHNSLDEYTQNELGHQKEGLLNNTSGTAISYAYKTNDKEINALGVNEVKFGLICNTSLQPEASKSRVSHINSTVWIFFEGIQACGLSTIEPSVFMRNHIAFPLTLMALSVAGILIRRFSERLALTATGLLLGIFLTLNCLDDLELFFHFTPDTLTLLYFSCLIIGSLFAFFCFASRNWSIFVMFMGTAVTLGYTILSVYVLSVDGGISSEVFWFTNLAFFLLMALLSRIPNFYDDHAQFFLLSMIHPFFLVTSLAIIAGIYPDLLTIRQAKKQSIELDPKEGYWYFLGGQVLLSLVLVVDSWSIRKRDLLELQDSEEEQEEVPNSKKESLQPSDKEEDQLYSMRSTFSFIRNYQRK